MSETCDAESGQASWAASHEAGAAEWYESSLAMAGARVGGYGDRWKCCVEAKAVERGLRAFLVKRWTGMTAASQRPWSAVHQGITTECRVVGTRDWHGVFVSLGAEEC
jgi:hypothetical protein